MATRLVPSIDVGPGVQESAVRFRVRETTLVGNILVPENKQDAVLVFVHGWSGVRGGPHGLVSFLARRLAQRGFPSLRFDLRGRGESEGNGLALDLITMAEDVEAAAEFARRETGAKRVILAGLCSGGNVAIGVLPRIRDAAGLLLLSVYPFSDADAFSRDVHRTWHYLRVYWHKAGQPETWRRLLRGDVHVLRVLDVLFGHFLHKRGAPSGAQSDKKDDIGQTARGNDGRPAPKATATDPGRSGWGEKGRRHLENLLCGAPALMLYGTADPDAEAAEKYYREFAEKHGLPIRFHRVQGANHNFSSWEWKREVARLAESFCCEIVGRQKSGDIQSS